MEGRGGRGNFNKTGYCIQNPSPHICATCTGKLLQEKTSQNCGFSRRKLFVDCSMVLPIVPLQDATLPNFGKKLRK